MKNNFKFLIVLAILLAGCICVGSTFAADSSIDVTDVSSVDDTQNIEIAHDDSSQKDVEINNLQADEDPFYLLNSRIINKFNLGYKNYTLGGNYKHFINDIDVINITNHSVVIDGAGHTINADGRSGVFHISGNGVTIKNINFINCDDCAIYWEGRGANLINCTFTNSYSDNNGGAVYLAESYGNVNGCNFINSSSGGYGGAIYLGGNSLTSITSITNCNFINSFSLNGGGAIGGNDRVNISGCNFTSCIASWSGGAIYFVYTMINFSDCNFVNCSSMVGGAIYLNYTTGEIIGCNFTNSSSVITAGAIYWNTTDGWIISDGKVIGCNFINSSSGGYGGAIYLTGANASVSDCNFTNSNSTYGGVIYCNSTGSVSDCTFTNTLAEDGGAIYWKGSDGIIVGCNFTNSNASSGGAIYLYGTAITLDCDFINTTAKYGGAIYSYNTDCSISTCDFINTSADDGGAIYCYNTEGSVSDCTFINTSADDGGAIYCYNAESIVIGCDFINTSADDGGAIYWNGIDGSVSDCTFTNSNASTGGAIYWNGIDGSVSGCTFTNSNASSGGAIYWNNASGSVSGCTFTNINASYSGGAIYWDGANGKISDSDFNNSTADADAGAICWIGINGNVTGCNFTNSNSSRAGAIRWCSENGSVSGCTFTNINAHTGGTIIWEGANGKISDSNFNNSNASEDAGAIYWNSMRGNVSDCNFTNTNTIRNGGAIYWLTDYGNISGCNFLNSTANVGGAIYWDNSKFCNVTDSIFTNCSATLGPAMYIHYASDLSINNCSNTPKDNDFKAPIYNNGTIVSDVVITTIEGKVKKVTEGEVVNLKGIITASDIRVAGGVLTLTVDGNELNATSDETGLYSKEYTVGFTGTKPVTAIYNDSTGELQSLIPGKLTTGRLDVTVTADNVTGVFTETKNVTVTVVDVNGDPITGGVVTILWNGENQTQEVSNGTVTFDLVLTNVGNFTVTAYYDGSTTTDYQDGEGNFTVIADKATPHISISDKVIGEFSTVYVNVTYLDNPVPGTVELYVDGNLTDNCSLVDGKTSFTFANPLTIGEHTVLVKYLGNDNFTEASAEYSRKMAGVNIIAEDIVYGDNLTVNITIIGVDGVVPTGNVTISVNGVEEGSVNLINGKCSYIITDLAADNYRITANYNGDNNYFSYFPGHCDVNVSKANTTIGIIADDVIYGNNGTIIVTVPSDATGNVFVYINGNYYNAIRKNKTVFVVTTGVLDMGEYPIVAALYNDNNYNDVINDSVSLVVKFMSVDVADMVYGGNTTVDVSLYAGANGTITVYLDGTFIGSENITGSSYILPISGINAGDHNVTVTFDDNTYGHQTVNTTFNVAKCTPDMYVDIGSETSFDIIYGDTVVVIVTIPDNVTGTVSFSLDNDTWIPVEIVNGSAEYDILGLDAGNYIFFVRYDGNINYNQVYTENPFTIDQLKTTVTVDPVKGKAGEKVKITARVTDQNGNPVEDGYVIIGFNGKEYKAYVVNGIATVEVTLPNKAGTYSATAYYEGFNYNSSYAVFTVEVSDIPGPNPNPNPNPNPINNGVDMENTGNSLLVLLIALCAIGLESFRRKF